MVFVPFPHQMNDLVKLRNVLKIINKLISEGREIDDDTLGDTLFLNGIIASKGNLGLSLEEKLRQTKLKNRSLQPQLTSARELRRLFEMFGMLTMQNDKYMVTERGRLLLEADNPLPSINEKKAWYDGLINLNLFQPETKAMFKPARVMLEILKEGAKATRLLAFSFVVKNDSTEETERVKDIVRRIEEGSSTFRQEASVEGMSESNARNSVKIIPAIAEKVGLIERKNGMAKITPFGRTVLNLDPESAEEIVFPKGKKRRPFFRIISKDDDLKRKWKPLDFEDVEFDPLAYGKGKETIQERTDIHQETVSKLVQAFREGWITGDGNFDLLAFKGNKALLFEVKSLIDGDISDERRRIIEGIGELYFYEGFDVPDILKSGSYYLQKIMVFSQKPADHEHVRFLASLNIFVIWFDNHMLSGDKKSINKLKDVFHLE